MKNFLRAQPERYLEERKIGQTSFVIKRAIVFGLFFIPLNLLIWFFLGDDSKFGLNVIASIIISIGFSISEWLGLEYNYWKNKRVKNLSEIEHYGEKEK